MSKLSIILVRPQLGQNIGMVARAMHNFCVQDLRLVAPRDGWPNPDAGPAASGADCVLAGARVFDSLQQAKADCHKSYATAQHIRGMLKPVFTPQGFVEDAHALEAAGARIALVFGPERAGLTNEDVAACDALLTIPSNPDFGSLNIAMAVSICVYAWAVAGGAGTGGSISQPPPAQLSGDELGLATAQQVDGLIAHMAEQLDKRGYFYPPARAQALRLTLGNIMRRPGFSAQEVQTLRGIVRTLSKSPQS
jgi:tRNA/rRNA methyltransferase